MYEQTKLSKHMTEKTRIEIALLLPTVPDAHDACVKRISDLLKATDGIEAAHIPDTGGQEPGQLCIHYDSSRLSIGDVRDLAHRAGAELEKRFGPLLLKSAPMYARRACKVESEVRQTTGVLEASSSAAGILRIEFDRQATDVGAVQKIGVRILDEPQRPKPGEPLSVERKLAEKSDEHRHGGLFGERTELVFAALCGGLLLVGWFVVRTSPKKFQSNSL